jgi:hypothetical protein
VDSNEVEGVRNSISCPEKEQVFVGAKGELGQRGYLEQLTIVALPCGVWLKAHSSIAASHCEMTTLSLDLRDPFTVRPGMQSVVSSVDGLKDSRMPMPRYQVMPVALASSRIVFPGPICYLSPLPLRPQICRGLNRHLNNLCDLDCRQ